MGPAAAEWGLLPCGQVSDVGTIRLTVPGRLEYREVAVRAVAAACRLARGKMGHGWTPSEGLDLSAEFDAKLVSAFSEIFNNIVLHSYALRHGLIETVMWVSKDGITLEMTDTGTPFQLEEVPEPALDTMPDHGLGIHIAKSFADEISYQPGPPNVWRLTKHALSSREQASATAASRAESDA